MRSIHPSQKQQMRDFRKTGAIEAIVGGEIAETLSHKMANDLLQSRVLQEAYTPTQVETVRNGDRALVIGRRQTGGEMNKSRKYHKYLRLFDLGNSAKSLFYMARVTGLEPATSGVTGRHSNHLSYTRACQKRLLTLPHRRAVN